MYKMKLKKILLLINRSKRLKWGYRKKSSTLLEARGTMTNLQLIKKNYRFIF